MANLPIFDDLEEKKKKLYQAIFANREASQEVPELPSTTLPKTPKVSVKARIPQAPREFTGPPTSAKTYVPSVEAPAQPPEDQIITGQGGLASSDFDNLPRGTDPNNGGMDYRQRLYEYLNQRRDSQRPFEDEYKRLSENAGKANIAGNLISGLAESASMAGSLAGKRSAVGDFKPLQGAIYGAEKQKADNLMGLRQLSNREEIGDITLLRDTSRMGLDDLRRQKLYKDLEGKSKVSKTLPYFVPGEGGKPPKMMTLDGEGNVKAIDLPEGAKPTMESYQGLPTMYQGSTPVVGVLGTKSGEIKRTPMPGYQTMDQIDQRIKEIENEKKTAKDNRLAKLQDEELRLKKRAQDLAEKKQTFTEEKPEKGAVQKRLSPRDISKLNEAKNLSSVTSDLNQIIDKYSDIMGPIEGTIRSNNPYDSKAKFFDADLRRSRQIIGKLMEGGVLRREDERKYEEMLPKLSDKPDVARYKARQMGDFLNTQYSNHVKMLGEQGFDTSGLNDGTSKSSQRPSLKQMSREEKLRELDEHEGAGR